MPHANSLGKTQKDKRSASAPAVRNADAPPAGPCMSMANATPLRGLKGDWGDMIYLFLNGYPGPSQCSALTGLLVGAAIANVINTLEGGDDFFVMCDHDDGRAKLLRHLVENAHYGQRALTV